MEDEKALTKEIVELASRFGNSGYRRVTALLRHRGWRVHHKRVERIWRREGLKVPAKQPKRGRLWRGDGSCVRLRPEWKDHVWAYDFVQMRLHDGRAVRLLTVMGEYTRECLAIRADRSMRSPDVIETLAQLMMIRGVPDHIRSDNGPEFTARAVREWLGKVRARTLYIEPGSPWENGYIESTGGKLRDELLDREIFYTDAGVEGADRAVQADLQPGQTGHLPGLQAADAGDLPTCRSCSGARRCNIRGGTKLGGRSSSLELSPPPDLSGLKVSHFC